MSLSYSEQGLECVKKEIGELEYIMEDWKEYKLGEVLSDKGYIRGPFGSALKRGDMKDSGIPVYEQQHAIYQSRDFRFYIDENKFNEMKRFQVQTNDLVISCSGTVGKVTIIDKNDPKGIISQALLILRVNSGIILPKYLQYFFTAENGYNSIISRSSGSVQVNIAKRDVIEGIPLHLPPLPTQQKIAQILSSLDDKIELNNKINANLEQQAQALFKSWFVDFEPFGGEMPAGWKEVGFKDICINITDGVHNTVVDDPNGTYILLSCKNIKGGVLSISSDERLINEETFLKLRKRTKLEKGDILLSSVGTIGEMLLLNEEPTNFEFQRSVAIIKPDNSKISSAFLYESMLQQKETIIHSAHGAVQQCIFISDIGDFQTILPTLEIIKKYTGIVQPMLDTITANQNENKKLSNLRDTLLPKLMNGEIEV